MSLEDEKKLYTSEQSKCDQCIKEVIFFSVLCILWAQLFIVNMHFFQVSYSHSINNNNDNDDNSDSFEMVT